MIFYTRKLWYFKTIHIKSYFFGMFFFNTTITKQFTSSNVFTSKAWFSSTCFFNVILFFNNIIQLCSFLLFLNKKTKLVWQNIEHMIWGLLPINNGLVIFNIKGPTKCIFSIFLFTHTNLISSFLHMYWWYWIVFTNFYFAPSFLLEVFFHRNLIGKNIKRFIFQYCFIFSCPRIFPLPTTIFTKV